MASGAAGPDSPESKEIQQLDERDQPFGFGALVIRQLLPVVLLVEARLQPTVDRLRQGQPRMERRSREGGKRPTDRGVRRLAPTTTLHTPLLRPGEGGARNARDG
jgi:hypothetical protein